MHVRSVNDPVLKSIFLDLPAAVYSTADSSPYGIKDLPNDRAEEAALLAGTHTLSEIIHIEAFLLFRGDLVPGETPKLDNCLARLALIENTAMRAKDRSTLCFGFFDARFDTPSIVPLIQAVEARCRDHKATRLLGPINASFWLKYRFKLDQFNQEPYFGEPINPPYYPALFLEAGFTIDTLYSSNFYGAQSTMPKRMQKRLDDFKRKNVQIRAPKRSEIDRLIPELYALLSDLFRDFRIYHPIDAKSFETLFSSMKLIISRDLIRLAISDGAIVGFIICFPDYGSRLGSERSVIEKVFAIIRKRKMKRAVLLYLGVRPAHLGLATAMIADLKRSLDQRNLPLIGALIQSGKVTADYAASEIISTNQYALLAKTVSTDGLKPDMRVI